MVNDNILRFGAVCERVGSLLEKVEGLGNIERYQILLSLWECITETQKENLDHLEMIVFLKKELGLL